MAFIKLQFQPGINRNTTNYSGEGGWWECDKIRFRTGYPEKIGGWKSATSTTYSGVCRQMHNWVTSYNDNILSLGTNSKLYLEVGGYIYNITPLRATNPVMSTPDTDNSIGTTISTTTITVSLGTVHNASTGDFVTISGVVGDIGGVPVAELNGNHEVTVVTTSSFSFETTSAATSTTTGGGTTISIDFELAAGNPVLTAGYGWGTDTWGRDAWGLGSTTPIYFSQRDWWLDNFDNDLVAAPRGGSIYYWARGVLADPGTALDTKAVTLASLATAAAFDPDAVPSKVNQILISQNDRHLLAFGAVPFGSTDTTDFDPMLIRWADQDTPEDWTPSVTNTAGDLRASRGSMIVRAMPTRQEILVWTDNTLYGLQFLGTTDVFGMQEYASNISIMSPRACVTSGSVVYWMGNRKFYTYTGQVQTLESSVSDYVFGDFNFGQAEQVVCGTNEAWDEIWWHYPSGSSNWNDRYVIYNYVEQVWYYGTMGRTAWLDTSVRNNIVSATSDWDGTTVTNSKLYSQEDGLDADGVAMTSYIQSNDFDLADGEDFMLTKRLIPDLRFDGSTATTPTVSLEIRPRRSPGSAYQNDPADTQDVIEASADIYTEQVFIRARARQMAIKINSDTLGVQWRLGAPRLDARLSGKR